MLTTAQKATLKAHIDASADLNVYPNNSDGAYEIAKLLNLAASPSFTVWKSSVPAAQVGTAFDAAALDAMTSGTAEKLSNFRAWNDTVYPTRPDHRAFFDGIFSVASGATTRASLAVLWKRLATRAEKLYATGTGSDSVPATIGWEGSVTYNDVLEARNS